MKIVKASNVGAVCLVIAPKHLAAATLESYSKWKVMHAVVAVVLLRSSAVAECPVASRFVRRKGAGAGLEACPSGKKIAVARASIGRLDVDDRAYRATARTERPFSRDCSRKRCFHWRTCHGILFPFAYAAAYCQNYRSLGNGNQRQANPRIWLPCQCSNYAWVDMRARSQLTSTAR